MNYIKRFRKSELFYFELKIKNVFVETYEHQVKICSSNLF